MKRAVWLLVAAVALLAGILGARKMIERGRDRAGFVFDTTRVSEVTSLRVIYRQDTATLVRRGSAWVLAAEGTPANSRRMEKALRDLLGIRGDEKVSASGEEARLREFGLDSLQAKRVEWTFADGEKARVLLGNTSGADLSSTYWKREDAPGVYRTPGSFTYDIASVEAEWKAEPR